MARSPIRRFLHLIDDHHRAHTATRYARSTRRPSSRRAPGQVVVHSPPPSLLLGRGGEREAAARCSTVEGIAAQLHERNRWMMPTSPPFRSLRCAAPAVGAMPSPSASSGISMLASCRPPRLRRSWLRPWAAITLNQLLSLK